MSASAETLEATEIRLRFLDLDCSVRTDVPEVSATCRDLFGRFLVADGDPRTGLEILSNGNGGWRIRDEVLDAAIDRRSWLPGIAVARLLEMAGNHVDSHDLFHGAGLSYRGSGLMLLGESGFGKSLLTFALLARGWRFFSDEVAAVDRSRLYMNPFPKALEVRPGALELLGSAVTGTERRPGKIARDAESLFPGCLSPACALTTVVFLEAWDEEKRPEVGSLQVVVHRQADGLVEALRKLDAVRDAAWGNAQGGFPVLSLRYEPGRFAPWRLDELLGRHGTLILDCSSEQSPPQDFDHEPRLEPLKSSEGVARLLSSFRGRRALPRRVEAHPEGFSGLFSEFLNRLQGVRFHRLRVGRLGPSQELLEKAVG